MTDPMLGCGSGSGWDIEEIEENEERYRLRVWRDYEEDEEKG